MCIAPASSCRSSTGLGRLREQSAPAAAPMIDAIPERDALERP